MYNLDLTSEIPLYQQIVDQTKVAIANRYFYEGDKLPSIRDMAKTLMVNQSTVSKAYRELESSGFIKTVPGKGTFISFDERKIELEKENMAEKLMEVFRESLVFSFTKKEIESLYDEVLKEEELWSYM